MNAPSPIIGLLSPVSIQADGKKGPAKFEATIYTGVDLNISGYDLPCVIDLAGLSCGNCLVANLDHDSTKRIGNFSVTNDGKTLLAHGVASAATPWRDEVVASAKDGYQWQASIEVMPSSIQTLKRGETANINGRTFTGPKYITRKGVLKGFGFVSHGADDFTSVAIAARYRGNKMENADFQSAMAETFPHVDMSLMTPAQLAGWHANLSGRDSATDADFNAVAPMIHASSDPVEIEQRRLRQIDAACRDTWGEYADRVDELKAAAIGGDFSVDELLTHLRDIRREKSYERVTMARPISAGRRDNPGQLIEAAFCLAGGLANVEKHYPEQVLDIADKMQRNTGLQSFLMQGACANGGYQAQPAESITQGNLRRVLEAAFAPQHAATGFSYANVPGILSNISNKFLFDGWQETSGDEWRKVSEKKPVKDFKTATFYRMLESAEYEQVGAGGEIKHGTLSEQTMTAKANTYGKMYAITREAIINDDLGALTDIPRRLGRAAGMKFRRVFWQAFILAADNFWHSTNGNVVTGSGTALTSAGTALQTALTAFRAMRTSAADGEKLIGGKPAVLMVPPALELVARTLLTSSGIVATTTADTSMPNGNPFQGLAELVVCDWLSDTDLTDYSAAIWYLLRSPSIAPAMIVAFLNGQESPTVETADADFNTLGIQMRGFHDFGVGRGEPLCGVQVAGTPA